MSNNFVITIHLEIVFEFHSRIGWRIINAPAVFTSQVIMIRHIGVKSLLCAPELQFPKHVVCGKNLQVSVHCAQTDVRQLPANNFINLVGSRMEIHFLECIEEGTTPLSDGRNGLAVLRVLAAAQQSMDQSGAQVPLADLEG